jgi:hypothetical protein
MSVYIFISDRKQSTSINCYLIIYSTLYQNIYIANDRIYRLIMS